MSLATQLFPLWALLFSAAAYLWPFVFSPLRPAIVPMLGVVMFGMGIGLTAASFADVVRRPRMLLLGVVLQFGLMPLLALGVATVLALPAELMVGLVLVGSCPGGTASNVVCYLAKADVALSITLTSVSTLLAVLATPFLVYVYAGRTVEVDVVGMIASIVRVVLVPVALGVAANRLLGARLEPVKRVFPLVSVAAIVVIIAIVVAVSADSIGELSGLLFAAVALHNGCGLLAGYALPRLFGCDETRSRTLAIEVGMQNSGLAVALSVQYFSSLAALPGALFSIWHNLTGSALAGWWSRSAAQPQPDG